MSGAAPRRFGDLAVRLASALAMAALAAVMLWAGTVWFAALCGLIVGAMVWEMQRLLSPVPMRRRAGTGLAVLAGGAVLLTSVGPSALVLPLAIAPALAALGLVRENRIAVAGFTVLAGLAGFGLVHVLADFGVAALLWLTLLVIATDACGYFAGRVIGGPKFWPRVSPKKTWSGTVAGWLGAAAVGAGFVAWGAALPGLVAVSVALSMAAQMGDAAESAIKRAVGVKDASGLIPGHGGVLDRFDGMFGAAIAVLMVERVIDLGALLGGA